MIDGVLRTVALATSAIIVLGFLARALTTRSKRFDPRHHHAAHQAGASGACKTPPPAV